MNGKLMGLLALLCALSPAVMAQDVTDAVDSTGTRVVEYESKEPMLLGAPILSIRAEASGKKTSNTVQFMVAPKAGRSGAPQAKYEKCHTLDWTVDGVPVKLGEPMYTTNRYESTVIEFIGQPITVEQIERFGRATKIDYRLCSDNFQLSVDDIAAFREIARRLGSSSSAQAPENMPSPVRGG